MFTMKATKAANKDSSISFRYLRSLHLPCHLVGSKLKRAKPEA